MKSARSYLLGSLYSLWMLMVLAGLLLSLLTGCANPNAYRVAPDYFPQVEFLCADGKASLRCSLMDGRAL